MNRTKKDFISLPQSTGRAIEISGYCIRRFLLVKGRLEWQRFIYQKKEEKLQEKLMRLIRKNALKPCPLRGKPDYRQCFSQQQKKETPVII
ncbi:hypothetical protein TNIN_494441 [Trichonephila inaurata madagascariensis]|uniref:Uncharacterized protein n=1 Tax=Trichonephila inaurata madagascariensis TaxID=2747483 RepID=A0A8X6XG69_9ARAC|nr:hypothetical protein TNIN_494441 [Trichonephila inaurata madagascariensis]